MADIPTWGESTPIDAEINPAQSPQMGQVPTWEESEPIEKYETTGQQLKTGLEGAAQGLLGPLAPAIEKHVLKVKPEAIRSRAEANPIIHGLSEVGGLTGGLLTGTGEAAVMGKAGKLAAEAAGLGETTLAARVGSEAAKQAAEMAILQGGDEVSKMILNDPNASAESAIANVGLAAAIGGAGGAFMTGAVNPLWKATAGPKVESLLNMTKSYINGGSKLVLGDAEEAAAKTLGIELDPVMRSGMSEDARANSFFSDLRRSEHPEVLKGLQNTHASISNSVLDSLGTTPEAVMEYSENKAGHDLQEVFQKEVKQKYDPRALEMQARDAEAAPIKVSDTAKLERAGNIIEQGMRNVGTDSPFFKIYNDYSERLINKNTVGEIDGLKTEIFNEMKKARRAGDDNTWKALSDVRNSLGEFQTHQIEKAALGAGKTSEEVIARRRAANDNYSKYFTTMDNLMDHLGLGEFKGTKGLLSKTTEKLSPEELLRKFTIKGNSDLIPFMAQHFPETLAKILENERKQLVKPAILAAAKKGEHDVDVKKLSDIIQKTMAGKPEYVKSVLPDLAIKRAEAGRILAEAIPSPRDSGTPAGLAKMFAKMPASAVSAVSWALGHGAIGGYMAGEMAQRLGKDAPEAIKLGYLRFLSSDQPVKAGAFKSMIDFLHATYKGETLLAKASSNVFKPGFQVLTDSQMPTSKEIAKLDKLVAENSDNSNKFMQAQNSSEVGHYLPNHQQALTQAAAQQLQYLQSLKPKPFKAGPLDKEIEPSKMAEARYNRALEIAQQPAVVLQHIKDGTLQVSDIQDIRAMYPAVYQKMAQNLTNEMINRKADEAPIPYKTRMGMSLFLGQPLDSSMTPSSIFAAQPIPKVGQSSGQANTKKGTTNLGKSNKQYRTPGQAAEADKASRD